MSDRFLAVTLALFLALPLCLSLDGDLFGRNAERTAHRQVEELLQADITKQTPVKTGQLVERGDGKDGATARQLPVLALGAMQQQAADVNEPSIQSSPSAAFGNGH